MDRNTKLSKANRIKSEIIVHCLDYLEKKDSQDKESAILKLPAFAKFYRVSLRKRATPADNLKFDLRNFILNTKGYNETINPLYNSLLNS